MPAPTEQIADSRRRLHYFGATCPAEQIACVCRAGQLLAAVYGAMSSERAPTFGGMLV